MNASITKLLLTFSLVLAEGLLSQEIRLVQIASGISGPTDIQHAGDGTGRLFFVQQQGVIRVFRNGEVLPQPFLDIRGRVRAGGERGLLGLAFPPAFGERQHFYVNYTDLSGNTVIAQYRVSSNPDAADPASEIVLLNITQPFANHNGGQLRFGPDGYLYVGMGDGGSGGDPQNNAQRLGTLLGKMLRLDVESEPGRVRIPPDNPFLNTAGARPEIWAFGLRNPWRFAFDRATSDLWIADVGQDRLEEVNFQPAASRGGENYGWNLMEGTRCFRPGCSTEGLTLPVAEYGRENGCSVTGGFVYRGSLSPGLRGIYIYGDYCSGRIWGVERRQTGWTNQLLLASGAAITTFGEDESGEIYVANAANGTIHRIEEIRPQLTATRVVNAASFAAGMAPGSLATVFVRGVLDAAGILAASQIPLPASLGGVSVTAGGLPAPIHAVAHVNGQEQVNFQVPFEMAGRPMAPVIVTRSSESSAALDVPVADLQPGIYTTDGVQAVVVRNADYSLVTPARPLRRGEFAFVYAGGLGPVANQPQSGSGAPAAPLATASADVRVTVAGLPCEVQYAGLAPGLVGVYQVNFRLPENVASGLHELIVSADTVSSPAALVPVE